ncbi:MAG: 1-acyl-sn-glycerol-3-phosphate acyltransferase [Bacteroidales bacterium]|nr:1-acyl-sn-glycerol-3-phosphate acyltransferase [Bacteroidales bacterium]
MKKIYEDDWWYDHLRYIVDAYIHGSFKKIRYEGLERIPKDGAVIFAPNHCDALMDPFAVLAMDHSKKVFVARADIFRKPVLRKILTFLKIMPINRVRDGFRSVINTEETIEKSIEVLNNRVPFCILPEGMHRSMHSLLPLGKGIARIALGADKAIAGERPVYIVPLGCEYGDYYRFRSTLLVTVGEPVDISAFIAARSGQSEAALLNDIRTLTAEGMKKLIVYIPDDDDYEAVWELAKLASGPVSEFNLRGRLETNRRMAEKLGRLRENEPEKARKLFDKALAYARARRQARISTHATYTERPLGAALWRTLKTVLGMPFALLCGAASLPAWGLGEYLAAGVKDRTFRNSFRCVAILLVWTLLLIAWTVVLLCSVKWYWALAALVLLVPAPMLAYDWAEQLRRCASAWRYLGNGRVRRMKNELKENLKTI